MTGVPAAISLAELRLGFMCGGAGSGLVWVSKRSSCLPFGTGISSEVKPIGLGHAGVIPG